MMNSYEEFKNQSTARGNTVAHNKAREACWQKGIGKKAKG